MLKFSSHLARAHFTHDLNGAEITFLPYVARARFAHDLDGTKR